MKLLFVITFFLNSILLYSQSVKYKPKLDSIAHSYHYNFPVKIGCPLNQFDSTVLNCKSMCDTGAYIERYSGSKLIAALDKSKNLNSSLNPRPTIPSFKLKFNGKEQKTLEAPKEEKQTQQLIIENSIKWFIEEKFDTTGISTDYNYFVYFVASVNCKGELYNVAIALKNEKSITSQYEYSQWIIFLENLNLAIQKLPVLKPAMHYKKTFDSMIGFEINYNKSCNVKKIKL